MNENYSVFGAKAEVYLSFGGGLHELADKLSKGLVHVPFEVQSREIEPYDMIGSCEALGFEMWLECVDAEPGLYRFRMETEQCLKESLIDNMHDLSLWLAHYITSICEIDAVIKI
jgi:hypothetical protein